MKTNIILLFLVLAAVLAHASSQNNSSSDKADEVVIESATWGSHSLANVDAGNGGAWEEITRSGNYTDKKGGQFTYNFVVKDTNGIVVYTSAKIDTIAPDRTIALEHTEDSKGLNTNRYNVGSITVALEIGSLSGKDAGMVKSWSRTSNVKQMLHVGGTSTFGGEALVAVSGGSGAEVTGISSIDGTDLTREIAKTALTVDGSGKSLDASGAANSKVAVGSSSGVTLVAAVPDHTFVVGADAPKPVSSTRHSALTNPDPHRTTIGVGEEVDLSFMPLTPSSSTVSWETTSGLLDLSNGPNNKLIAPDTDDSSKVTAKVTDTSGRSVSIHFLPFKIVPPRDVNFIKNGGDKHVNGDTSAGFSAIVQILPTSVSFYAIKIREDAVDASDASDGWAEMKPHKMGAWKILDDNNIAGIDRIASRKSGVVPGGYTWAIPMRYTVFTEEGYVFKHNLNHVFSADNSGTATQSKNGVNTAAIPVNATSTDWPFQN